jgi:exonuclease SbcD
VTTARFIHTSDLHLDTSFSGCGFPSRLGARKREAIRAALRKILDCALEKQVDFVLIAGDLFEHDRITPDTLAFLKQQFSGLGNIRVFIAPGNHDPYLHGSPYRDESWPANVHIFREEEFRSVELPELGVRITGFGFNGTQVDQSAFLNLPALPDDLINLVVAHGSNVDRAPVGKRQHAPFRIGDIAGKNIRYCALGHYHQQHRVPNPLDQTEVWYSGIPEGRGWDEPGECGFLLGEIDSTRTEVVRLPCGRYPFQTLSVDCDGFSSREQILDAILRHRGTVFDDKTILKVRLQGAPDPDLDLSFADLEGRLADEILHVVWENETAPALDMAVLAQEKTLRGNFLRIMNDRIAAASETDRVRLDRARLYGLQALLGRNVRLL